MKLSGSDVFQQGWCNFPFNPDKKNKSLKIEGKWIEEDRREERGERRRG
jgi:hypothetical protein